MTTINMPLRFGKGGGLMRSANEKAQPGPIVNERISIDQQLSDDDFVTAYAAATEGYSQADLRICDEQGDMFTSAVHDRLDAIAQANVKRVRRCR